MKFIVLFGPQAVGKMTVGQELAKITGLKLFHNHMTIELVSQFFDYGMPAGKRLVSLFRREIFEEVAKSELPGLIFTYVWGFNLQEDWDYVRQISDLFESRGAEVYWVELEADLAARLERNKDPHRLQHKPTKRNIERSEQDLLKTMEKYRLNSYEGEIQKENFMKINNTFLSPEETAKAIRERFRL
ncbi:AAA family ATPase [Paenibacillus macerans]|uniref:AAA family ATPase n=1 Tax=Paenibacillus macerans TaxID=44252 RepID=UPI002041EDF2|nr:AAA family ATPase [Paenibacillus macerans]MCM3699362.1 AAA family ATPase [Paenibacillus macerans]